VEEKAQGGCLQRVRANDAPGCSGTDEAENGWVSLHGDVPARKRGELIARFGKDPDCKVVFLSTIRRSRVEIAGGLGSRGTFEPPGTLPD